MWPDRRLLDLFKTEHPIVLAPMAGALPDPPYHRRRRPAGPELPPRRGQITKRAALLRTLLLLLALVSVAHSQDGPSNAVTALNAGQAFGLYLDGVLKPAASQTLPSRPPPRCFAISSMSRP
jgi:hypothetical protein